MDGRLQAAADAEDARPMEIDELAEDPDSKLPEEPPVPRQEEPVQPQVSHSDPDITPHDATAVPDFPTTSTAPSASPPIVVEPQQENPGMGNDVDELDKVVNSSEYVVEQVNERAVIHTQGIPADPQAAPQDQPEAIRNSESVVKQVNGIAEAQPAGFPKEQQEALQNLAQDVSHIPSSVQPEAEPKEGHTEPQTSEEQPMEGIQEQSTLIELSGNDSSALPPNSTTSRVDAEVIFPESNKLSNELSNETDTPLTSLPTAALEAFPTSSIKPNEVSYQASDQQLAEPSTSVARNSTEHNPPTLEGTVAPERLSAQPGSPSPASDDPFNLKSGDGVFDEPMNPFSKDEPGYPPSTDDPCHRFNEDGLADFSIPESRFAGVILPKADLRALRSYIPADELKLTSGLKITLRKPEGWIAPKMEAEDSGYTGRRRRGGVGRQVEWLTKNQTDSDNVEDGAMPLSPSRRRKSKRADLDDEDYDRKQYRGTQGEASPSVVRSGSTSSSQRERNGGDDHDLTDLSELDEIEARRKEKVEMIPTRQSGRIAVKERPSMAEDQELCISRSFRGIDIADGSLLSRHTTTRRGRAAIPVDDDGIDELARSYSEDSISSSSRPVKTKSRGRGKKTIDSDDDFEMLDVKAKSHESDQEIDKDVLIYHRELCDKCFRPSAKDLLKSKKRRGKKRKKQEFEEESGDEAERLMGWIECAIRQKALNEDKLLPPNEQIFRNGAPRKDDTLLLICPHCENELVANCMSCGMSDPLPQVTSSQLKHGRKESAETATGTPSAMKVDEASEVRTVDQSNMAENKVSEVQTNGYVDALEKAVITDTVQESSAGAMVEGLAVHEPVVVDGKKDSGKPPGQQMESDKTDVAQTSAEKKTDVDVASDKDELEDMQSDTTEEDEAPLLFRCISCKRCAHYQHLPKPSTGRSNMTVEEIAAWYQEGELSQVYKCIDCRKWDSPPEYILGWRSTSTDEAEEKKDLPEDALEDVKTPQEREYLVKWKGKAFRHATWVPHDYLSSISRNLLLSFLRTGMRVTLETESQIATKDSVLGEDTVEAVLGVDEDGKRGVQSVWRVGPPKADADAQDKIPVAWNTPDRILDVFFLKSAIHAIRRQALQNPGGTSNNLVEALDFQSSLKDGVKPADDLLVSVEDAERTLRRKFTRNDAEEMVKYVGWVYVKWQDLQYEAATWDTPILPPSPASAAFLSAFQAYLWSRTVIVPVLKPLEAQKRDTRPLNGFVRMAQQPSCVAGGQLMDFQLEGLNWLMSKWHNLQSCILADDMGLGKTVQIAAFLAYLGSEAYHVYPHLVVVPNSTLQNWTRELAKWAPHLRVVPYFGEKASRTVIREYELYHGRKDTRTVKTHVIVTTYEVITSKDFNVFAKIPRWETLIVDEAQRLKAGSSLIFKKLNELNAVHKVLLTGTPLNNTIREILNLMNFLDPKEFGNLEGLEKRYSVPDEELYKELRAKIAPFMLRRSKEEVLDLPPKNEIIVPLTMRPLQKEVYRGILERNADLMEALARINRGDAKHGKAKRGHIHNMLMQLRKCLQHPFLCNDSLEDYELEATARHQALIDGSAKLGFLKAMLPKLRAKGHRVLLFSQFKIALDIIEQFFDGEDFKYLRLDGDTPQAKRQKDIDAFNAPDSPYSVFLLSTRAGGVGINLASADTGYATNIMQASKKKLLLDHLIVQSLRKVEEEDDFATIVLNGAKAVFEDKTENDIVYSSEALDNMIAELEVGEKPEPHAKSTGFTFAPVYDTAQKSAGELPDLPEHSEPQDGDFWSDVLKRMEEETKAREAEMYGTGKRSRGKQISYADSLRHPNNSQEHTEPAEAEPADEEPKDAASQESDFALEQSDISDAEQMGGIQAEVGELAGPLAKKFKRVPTKLAIHPANGDGNTKTGLKLDREKVGERGVSSGLSDNDIIKKSRGRPRKAKSSLADALNQSAPAAHSALVSSQPRTSLQLAKAHISNLRYAAAECGIPDYAQRVQAILDVKVMPSTRWDAYTTLTTQVDEIFRTRGMAPIFSDGDVIQSVRPLFQEKGEVVKRPFSTNGGAPTFHKTKPSSRPFTAAQLTISTPSTAAASSTWTGQSHGATKTSGTSAITAHHSFTIPSTATPAATASAPALARPTKKRKHAPIASGVQPASASTQQAQASAFRKRKKNSEPATGPPASTCFFCTEPHETTTCPGLKSRSKIQEFATKVRESQGSAGDKAQWIRWLGDRERLLPLPVPASAPSQSAQPVSKRPRPVPKKRSSSLEEKAKAEMQKDKEDQEVEALIGLADADEIIEIDDSD
ncbi:hypothetical protein QFC21_003560 [Naganishia friedmannii]|uniref:Uncharacterized protein n=1 Tax=Naganishia friedmannii TaxID=89922 RepID=A0ACC2VPT5_9TREE|nr:hypothetical protein QFC21_003560 [Naganishia friedmannii]